MPSCVRLALVCVVSAATLAACGDGSSSPAVCPGVPQLTYAFAITGTLQASPSPATDEIEFYPSSGAGTIAGGVPDYRGSDGSTIVGGPLTVGLTSHATLANSSTVDAYVSTVAGLHPNVTYSVTITGLTAVPQSGGTSPTCTYPDQNAGSFTTVS